MSKKKSFCVEAIIFNKNLFHIQEKIKVKLPPNYRLMNPFIEGKAFAISSDFYHLFYEDNYKRRIVFGINPGRHGAGQTGVPFTDSKKLAQLGISSRGIKSFEPSSVFIYQVVESFGGAKKFYQQFYFNSPLPLGIIRKNGKNNWVNANYYDNTYLQKSVEPIINYTMQIYQKMPIEREICYCLGKGKNYQYLEKWNKKNHFFGKIIPLAHPRYIMQYKFSEIKNYKIDYLEKLSQKINA